MGLLEVRTGRYGLEIYSMWKVNSSSQIYCCVWYCTSDGCLFSIDDAYNYGEGERVCFLIENTDSDNNEQNKGNLMSESEVNGA